MLAGATSFPQQRKAVPGHLRMPYRRFPAKWLKAAITGAGKTPAVQPCRNPQLPSGVSRARVTVNSAIARRNCCLCATAISSLPFLANSHRLHGKPKLIYGHVVRAAGSFAHDRRRPGAHGGQDWLPRCSAYVNQKSNLHPHLQRSAPAGESPDQSRWIHSRVASSFPSRCSERGSAVFLP